MNKQTTTLTIATALAIATMATTAAQADHVDNYIQIETAEGLYTPGSTSVLKALNTITNKDKCKELFFKIDSTEEHEFTIELTKQVFDTSTHNIINNNPVIEYHNHCYNNSNNQHIRQFAGRHDITPSDELIEFHHQCICDPHYANTIKDEYTFTITDLPNWRFVSQSYKEEVKDAIQAGLDSWGSINDIDFTYTTSKLKANIIIQQTIPESQRGDRYIIANAEFSCLHGNNQCTIQLFTDLNLREEQTLLDTDTIKETIEHEFGHLIGLPHTLDPNTVMSTPHDDNVRTYYEARGIIIPGTEGKHTHEQEDTRTTPPNTNEITTIENLRQQWQETHKEIQQKDFFTKEDTDKILAIMFNAIILFTNNLVDLPTIATLEPLDTIVTAVINLAEIAVNIKQ